MGGKLKIWVRGPFVQKRVLGQGVKSSFFGSLANVQQTLFQNFLLNLSPVKSLLATLQPLLDYWVKDKT